ncbi:hypothetical protein Ddye_020174 [Dipteronia dyeriana]|uniref:Pentatricopeptide repeat-containing protein n=1 Tax=Dipteronia dyeriana TaxID=168575 RepID=A0AAD9TZ48_9ROSI|nr:hypothetical protein Ddye_020174 [Dipteronia dyeriana]
MSSRESIFTWSKSINGCLVRSLTSTLHTPDRVPLVTSITELLRNLNPQNSEPNNIDSTPLNQFSHHLDSKLVIQVIKEQTNPFHALFFFDWASNPNPNNYYHTHLCYVAITHVLLSHSLFSTATSLLQKSHKLSHFFIGMFIKARGDRGDIRAAMSWLDQAKKIENGNCLFSYNSILGVLVGKNRMKLAEEIFDQIVKDNVVQPDVSTYTTMIKGYCKLGMIEIAGKVFDEMFCEPNLVTYNTLINGLRKKGDMESARLIFNRMMNTKDCSPDTVTYSTMIDGYCKIGDIEEAKKCLTEMGNRGCKPNVFTYNALINGLCTRGRVDDAKLLITKMRFDGLKDNIATHTSISKWFCVVRKSEQAVKYLRDIIKSNMTPDLKSYVFIINECCKLGNSNEAISLLKEMQERGIKASVSSFNAVLRIRVGSGKLDIAVLLLKQRAQMGCSPNFLSYNTVICSLCMAKGRMREVEELVNNMTRSGASIDANMYNCLIKGYCKEDNEEMETQIAYEIVSKKYVVNLDNFSVLLEKLRAKKKVNEAKKIFQLCIGFFKQTVGVI